METYDPSIPPNADEWLAVDELERIELVKAYHRKVREPEALTPETWRSRAE